MKNTVWNIIICSICLNQEGCYYDVQEDLHPSLFSKTCDTSVTTYTKVASILSVSCYSCHSQSLASGNINLDNYAGVKSVADNGRLIGSIEHSAGFRPMPQGLSQLSVCDRLIIAKWVANSSSNN